MADDEQRVKGLVVIAHPDDEVIWMGGLILRHPGWDWRIVSLCRAGDPDRAPRFLNAARVLGAAAFISDLDDSPVLAPLSPGLGEIRQRLVSLAAGKFDFIFTHGEKGEYTRHERHEQVHRAVRSMVHSKEIVGELIFFAYDDHFRTRLPAPAEDADLVISLRDEEYAGKRRIISDIYGFGPDSFELNACGHLEAFRFHSERQRYRTLELVIKGSD